jgi:hypothetical protein
MLGAAHLTTTDPGQAAAALSTLEAIIADRNSVPPMVRLVEETIFKELAEHPDFAGRLAEDVGVVVRAAIRYVAYRLGNPTDFMKVGFSEETVVEQHLADDVELFLGASPLSRGTVAIEARRIGGGRADLVVGFATHRVIIELKRELNDATVDTLETHYADQAASYQATDYPFGIVMVLDLTADQTASLAHLRDLVWTSNLTVTGSSDRLLVWCVIPGRRVTPSTLSR